MQMVRWCAGSRSVRRANPNRRFRPRFSTSGRLIAKDKSINLRTGSPTPMLAFVRSAARRHDLLTFAGLAAGVVPLAAMVHLIAEFAATAPGPADAFVARHLYMLPLVIGALVAFGTTLGLGRGHREFVRRSALIRATLGRVGTAAGIRDLFLANLAFFAATQALEGVPIAAGSVAVGLAVAAAGSLIAAFAVFALGRTVAVAAGRSFRRRSPRDAAPIRTFPRRSCATRRAARAFSLCLPNRPPPVSLSI